MYDLAVIGLGPAGLEACEVAIKNNLKVIAFEENLIGGTCLNAGCIPTKAILHSANLYKEIKNSKNQGISCENLKYNWEEIIEREKNIVSKFNTALYNNLSKKIEIVNQKAELIITNDEVLISAQDNIYEAQNIIVATGSKPKELKGLEFNHENILNSDDLLNLKQLPKSIAIIGSGAIGLEWAMILSAFDVEVTIIEKMETLAPSFDIDVQKRLERILKSNNIKFYKNDFIKSYEDKTVTLNSSQSFEAEKILVAIGREPNSINLSYNDLNMQTSMNSDEEFDNVYLTGDSSNKIMLAHFASYQAKNIVNKILEKNCTQNKLIPSVIYLTPEIASIGLKEQDIKDDDSYEIKKILTGSIAKSWCEDASEGIVKVIIKDNKIKGAHVISKNASLLISIFNILIEKEVNTNEINEMVFPHPCFSELIYEVLK